MLTLPRRAKPASVGGERAGGVQTAGDQQLCHDSTGSANAGV
jgi:hypothetical protein